MAKPSDLLGEVVAIHEQTRESGEVVRRNKDKHMAQRAEALSLRLAGLTYEQIGDRLGVTKGQASDLIKRTLRDAINPAAEEMRELENNRLDRAQAAVWSKVIQGDLRAIDTFLRISSRRATLNGLDAPQQINLSVSVRQEMEQALQALEQVVLDAEVIEDDAVEQ